MSPSRTHQPGGHYNGPRQRSQRAGRQTPEYSDDDDDTIAAHLQTVNDERAPNLPEEEEDEDIEAEPNQLVDDDGAQGQDEADVNVEDGNLEQQQELTAPPLPPLGLKEISSLASWTVSSAKPGCGVAALRAPTTQTFWQSDGPQPHWLNIHFFKMVSICRMRIYLDYPADESYTPGRIEFLAGTHAGDLQLWSELQVREPRGWLVVDFSDVGDVPDGAEKEDDSCLDIDRLPILRCMLLQLKICENHQNGKDTHLRGLQILARDEQPRVGMQSKSSTLKSRISSGLDVPYRTKRKEFEWEDFDDDDGLSTIPTIR